MSEEVLLVITGEIMRSVSILPGGTTPQLLLSVAMEIREVRGRAETGSWNYKNYIHPAVNGSLMYKTDKVK